MSLIPKINASRKILKEYLKDEWDTMIIHDLSDKEVEKMYIGGIPKNSKLISFGSGSACNFTLFHKDIPSHKLHVIYYNFPELGRPHTKITKDCAKKVQNLYTSLLDPEDSIIVIIIDPISENLSLAIEEVYSNGQETLFEDGLSETILEENQGQYFLRHFRNIHIFQLEHLTINIKHHSQVPEHIAVRKEEDITTILTDTNAKLHQLPIIQRNDIQAKILRLAPGDICKITRRTVTGGDIPYYRVCK
jgi:DNA-directed RNA polymerase subunit H (RpoH/RPB5)